MSKFSILVAIVPHEKGEKLTKSAVEAGSGGGTVLMGTQSAKTNLGAILGLSEKKKDLILMLVEKNQKEKILNAIIDCAKNEKKDFGTIFSLASNAFLKGGALTQGGIEMQENATSKVAIDETQNPNNAQKKSLQKLIWIIVNKGFAEDTMFAARKAGAGGGTILNARGTAREDDEKFFGVHIVPEKEMLLIAVPPEKYQAVLESIRNLKYLSEPGSGIAFTSDIEDFSILGKK